MMLSNVAVIALDMPVADFWIQADGNEGEVGTIHGKYAPGFIGVKISELTILNPVYFAYKLKHCHNLGFFKRFANLDVNDVRNMKF